MPESKKKAAEAKAQEATAVATAESDEKSEKAKERQVNLLVKTDNIRERTRQDGHTFKSVCLPLQMDGETKFGYIAVDDKRVQQATKPQIDDKGNVVRNDEGKVQTNDIEGYSKVWLRGESSKVKVNVANGKDENGKVKYETLSFTAGEIETMNKAAKSDYKQTLDKEDQKGAQKQADDEQIEV